MVAAFAYDAQHRLWVATADYTDTGHDALLRRRPRPAPKPVKVVSALYTLLGLLWYHELRCYVTSTGRADAHSGFAHHRFALAQDDPDAARARGREQRHRAQARTAAC